MQTERDAAIVDWISRIGAAQADQVAVRFGMGRSSAYERLRVLAGDGLLERHALLHRQPALYTATRQALRWQGLQAVGPQRLSPASFEHARTVTGVAIELEQSLPAWKVVGEREIRRHEHNQGQLLASIELPSSHGNGPAVHRPDLALLDPDGRVVAVEVELTAKAPRRLAVICRGWARARHIHHTHYLTTPTVQRALQRAVKDTRAEDRITILALDQADTLAETLTQEVTHAGVR